MKNHRNFAVFAPNFALLPKILTRLALKIFAGCAGKIFRGGPLLEIFQGGVAFKPPPTPPPSPTPVLMYGTDTEAIRNLICGVLDIRTKSFDSLTV